MFYRASFLTNASIKVPIGDLPQSALEAPEGNAFVRILSVQDMYMMVLSDFDHLIKRLKNELKQSTGQNEAHEASKHAMRQKVTIKLLKDMCIMVRVTYILPLFLRSAHNQ